MYVQMSAFEILLDQDPDLKLDEQEKVLRSIAVAYEQLQADHSVRRTATFPADTSDDAADAAGDGGVELDQDLELELELAQLDSSLAHLTNRVEVGCLSVLFL